MPSLALPSRRLPMLPLRNLRICSHPFRCVHCGNVVEAIARTPREAEKLAVDLYSQHLKRFHATDGAES